MPFARYFCIFINVGLGDAASRSVGEGYGQLPDMSSFANSLSTNGYQKLPGGLILQWGRVNTTATGGTASNVDVTFPIAFASAFYTASAIMSTNDPSQRFLGFDIATTNTTKIRFTYQSATTNTVFWSAIGK